MAMTRTRADGPLPETELVWLLDKVESGPRDASSEPLLVKLREAYVRTIERLARAREGLEPAADPDRLNDIVARAARVLHVRRPLAWADAVRWLRVEAPRELWAARHLVWIAAALLVGGFAAGFASLNADSKILRLVLPPESVDAVEGYLATGRAGPLPQLLSGVLTFQHLPMALLAVCSGVLLGLGPAVLLFWGGLQMGVLATMHIQAGALGSIAKWLVAFGAPGLAILLLSGAAGLAIGFAIVAPGVLTRRMALARAARQAACLLAATAPLFAFEALMSLVL